MGQTIQNLCSYLHSIVRFGGNQGKFDLFGLSWFGRTCDNGPASVALYHLFLIDATFPTHM